MFEQLKENRYRLSKSFNTFLIGFALITVFYIYKNLNLILGALLQFLLLIRPIIIAFGIAYVLNRPMMWIESALKKIEQSCLKKEFKSTTNRAIAILILFVIVTLSIYTLFNSIIPPIIQNLRLLLESLPVLQQSMSSYINEIRPYIESFVTDQQIAEISNFVTEFLNNAGTQILQIGTGVITNVTGFIISTLTTIVLSVYFLKDKEILIASVRKGGEALLSEKMLAHSEQFLHDLDHVFGGFLIAQLIAALLAGIFSTLILLIIGHPFAILVGLVTGVANVIPYIGPILGAALGGILGLFSSIHLAVLSLALLTIYQQLDANVIQPKLLSNSVGLNPVWVLIAILIGGYYLGMVGMIVSIPTAALIKIYISRRYYRLQAAK